MKTEEEDRIADEITKFILKVIDKHKRKKLRMAWTLVFTDKKGKEILICY